MGNRETMLELVRRAYAARGKGDLDDLMTAFHPEAVFTLVGDNRSLKVAGSVQGHRNLRESLGAFIATFKFEERKILSELVEEDRAAVHSRLVLRYNPSGTVRTTDVSTY
jgi:ketosteroid isomerase-like protein